MAPSQRLDFAIQQLAWLTSGELDAVITTAESYKSPQIDRLSSLPHELLLIIFNHLRLASDNQSVTPLSRALQPFHRINLYHSVRIRNCATLVKFYNSLTPETTGLGHLVYYLDIEIFEREMGRFSKDHGHVLAGIRDLLPQLREIDCWSTFTLGNIFMDRIGELSELRVVGLRTTASNYMDLLKLKKLQIVRLQVLNPYDWRLEEAREPVIDAGELSLDKFVLDMRTASPLLGPFLQSIRAKEVVLAAEGGSNRMDLLLATLDSSRTSKIILTDLCLPPIVVDAQLNRFHQLRNLTLRTSVTVSESFFKTILGTPLVVLHLDHDFDLDAQNLIDALNDPTRVKRLKFLRLDNIDAEEYEDEIGEYGPGGSDVPDCWTDICTMQHIIDLRSMAKTGRFELTGTTVEAQEICQRILEGRGE